ncbi:MAG: ectoine hydroxylase [Luteitalea sp.]|nr:ectoine hydroxylase [Luteitalea sp.]
MEDVYPSRVGDRVRLIERADPVIYGTRTQPGPLTAEQLDFYEVNGFVVLPSLFQPDEIARLNAELRSLADSPTIGELDETITEPGSGHVRSIFRIHQLNEMYGRLARDERLAGAARQILSSEVYMHQSRVNLKPGFAGKEFYWHSDFETWHMEDGMPRMRALSISLALTENYPFNGPLMLMPGSHKTYISCVGETPANHYKESLKKQEYGVPDHESLTVLTDRGGIVAPTGPAGTAVLFDCNTMHGSNSNITPYPRSNVFFVYNSVENKLQNPFCGLTPRPEHIASRQRTETLAPLPTS